MGMERLRRFLFVLVMLGGTVSAAHAVSRAADYVAPHTYNNMYPYMTNSMRTNLTNGNQPNQNTAQIDVLTRTIGTDSRRVIPRRTATGLNTTQSTARAGTTVGARAASTMAPKASGRRVVPRTMARAAVNNNTVQTGARSVRGDITRTRSAVPRYNDSVTTAPVSSARCLADYTACMDGYCQRKGTAYDRCYCSSKLAQIDSKYKPAIDDLIVQIIQLKGTNNWNQAEMDEYWMAMVGNYSGGNSWTNIDNALNIDWASMEDRNRGQNAFNLGHEYCVQHLQGCFYMASNLRDAYRSEIARDCVAYENDLQKIKNAAESIVESYK